MKTFKQFFSQKSPEEKKKPLNYADVRAAAAQTTSTQKTGSTKFIMHREEGLWDNIHAKRKRIKSGSGEHMRKPGSKGAPSDADFRSANEEVMSEGGYPEVDHMPGRRLSISDTHKSSKYTVATNAKDGHTEHKVKVDASSENHARNLAADHFVKKGLKPRVHFDGVRVVKEEVEWNC